MLYIYVLLNIKDLAPLLKDTLTKGHLSNEGSFGNKYHKCI